MTKKSLQGWYNSNDINYSQKEIISKFGVSDYYPESELWNFKKIWYWNAILERNITNFITKLEGSSDDKLVHQMTFFSAWWNNNLILFIDGKENSYWVKLIVYEMPYRKNGETKIQEVFEVFSIDWICPGSLHEAKEKSRKVKETLRGNNPILCGTPTTKLKVWYYDDYDSIIFPVKYGIGGEEIKTTEIDFNKGEYYPDDYFKPLDIVKIFIPSWKNSNREHIRHTGIYLGNGKVCHLYLDKITKEITIADEDWKELFKACKGADKMARYHPIIPFKHKDKIVEHIAKSITKRNGNTSWSKISSISSENNNEYSLNYNNCEHMVNKCVLGLNFSEYSEKRMGSYTKELDIPKKNGETDSEFARKYNYEGNINEIRGYGQRAFNVNLDGVNMYDSYIEVQPKSSIFKDIMREYLNRR